MLTKVCSVCGKSKGIDEFPKSRKGLYGRRGDCKRCHSGKVKAKYHNWTPERYEQQLAYTRAYRKANPEKARLYDARKIAKMDPATVRQRAGTRMARWRALNPDKVAQANAERRIAVARMPAWGRPEMIEMVYKKAVELGLEVDHVVPLKSKRVSGLHVWWNLQLLDHAHNKAKNNRTWPDMP